MFSKIPRKGFQKRLLRNYVSMISNRYNTKNLSKTLKT